ncbi:hypothetical protein B4U79_11157, partial [Dinothrombium tinctorium]
FPQPATTSIKEVKHRTLDPFFTYSRVDTTRNMPTLEDLCQLTGAQLTVLCKEAKVPTWGKKALKAGRILDRLAELAQRADEESVGSVEGVEEMIADMLAERDIPIRPPPDEDETPSGSEQDRRRQHGPAEEPSALGSTANDAIAALVLQLARKLRTDAPQAIVNNQDTSHSAIQVPTFSGADDPRYTTSEWLDAVDRFAQEFRWNHYQTLRHAAARLTGPARRWQERVGETFVNFASWKAALIAAIPERSYSWEQKREMMSRRQRSDESVEEYILDKGALCLRFGLSITDAKEFLLGGLRDKELSRAMAAQRYESLADIIASAQEVSRVMGIKASAQKEFKATRYPEASDNCLRCGQPGHRKKDCRNDVQCLNCKQHGHYRRDCPRLASTQPKPKANNAKAAIHKLRAEITEDAITQPDIAEVNEIRMGNERRKTRLTRTARLNGQEVNMAIDTQSDISLIRDDVVRRVGPLSQPDACVTIIGITKDSIVTKGLGHYDLELDGVRIQGARFFAIPKKMMSTDIWLGKNVLDDERISLVLHGDRATFLDRSEIGGLNKISVEDRDKISLLAQETSVIPPRSASILLIRCEDPSVTEVRVTNQNNGLVPEGRTKISDGKLALPVVNVSKQPLKIKANSVVARCLKITTEENTPPPPSLEPLTTEDLRVGDNAKEEEKRQLVELCNRYRECFAKNIREIGCYPHATITIDLLRDEVINERRQVYSFAERRLIEDLVAELKEADVIEESTGPFNSRLVVVRKPDGTHRACVDFRTLNSITRKESFPSPQIDELVADTCGWEVYAVLDLANGYYQILVEEKSREKKPLSQLQQDIGSSNGCPSASSTHRIFLRYMDDIIIGARNFAELLSRIELVLQALKKAHLTLNRRTTDAESRYHSTELELLSVVWAVTRLRMFLYGKEFTLVTDCEAVRLGLKKRILVPRIARWVLQLQEFNFSVIHRPGKGIEHVDALSRNPMEAEDDVGVDSFTERFQVFAAEVTEDWIAAAQLKDELCQTIGKRISDSSEATATTPDGSFRIRNGRIYRICGRRNQLVIPWMLRRRITQDAHEKYGHPSLDGTADVLLHRFWFPRLRRTVRSVIGACIECLTRKQPGGRRPGMLTVIERKKPFNTLHIDHLGALPRSSRGRRHLLVAICNFTKMVFLRPVTTTAAKQTIQAINSIIEQMWVPDRIVVDRGTAFKNRAFQEYCAEHSIQLIFNSTANPRANGQVERVNRVLVPLLASLCRNPEMRDWDIQTVQAAIALNSRVNRSTGKTPMELMYGFRPRTVVDNVLAAEVDNDEEEEEPRVEAIREEAMNNIVRAQESQKKNYDLRRCRGRPFAVDDIVAVRRFTNRTDGQPSKLSSLYRGPFKISERLGESLYRITSIDPRRPYSSTAPADQLKRWEIDDDISSGPDEDTAADSGGPE